MATANSQSNISLRISMESIVLPAFVARRVVDSLNDACIV